MPFSQVISEREVTSALPNTSNFWQILKFILPRFVEQRKTSYFLRSTNSNRTKWYCKMKTNLSPGRFYNTKCTSSSCNNPAIICNIRWWVTLCNHGTFLMTCRQVTITGNMSPSRRMRGIIVFIKLHVWTMQAQVEF